MKGDGWHLRMEESVEAFNYSPVNSNELQFQIPQINGKQNIRLIFRPHDGELCPFFKCSLIIRIPC